MSEGPLRSPDARTRTGPNWPASLTNFVVTGYALDALISLAEELLRALTGSDALMLPRNIMATLVMYALMLSLPALVLTPRLPLSVYAPLVVTGLWLNLGAAPLPLWIPPGAALGISVALIQVGVSVAVFWRIRALTGGHALFPADSLDGPEVSLRHSAAVLAGITFLLIPATAAYGVVAVATWMQLGTGGFVRFDLQGVSLDDRRYARDDREIRLVGMMHVGEEDAYRRLVSSFVTESTVVLAEGVSDDEGLVDVPLSYQRTARALGLEEQNDIQEYLTEEAGEAGGPPAWPVVRNADVDMSDFAPETRTWLAWVAGVLEAEGPLGALRKIQARLVESSDEFATVQADIFDLRNEVLLGEIETALDEYRRVIVPWGALHLPAIETAIVEQGFDPTGTTSRRLISWLTIASALARDARETEEAEEAPQPARPPAGPAA